MVKNGIKIVNGLTVTVFDVHSGLCLQQQRQEFNGASESRMMKSWKTEERKIRNKPWKHFLETVKSFLDLWPDMFIGYINNAFGQVATPQI